MECGTRHKYPGSVTIRSRGATVPYQRRARHSAGVVLIRHFTISRSKHSGQQPWLTIASDHRTSRGGTYGAAGSQSPIGMRTRPQ